MHTKPLSQIIALPAGPTTLGRPAPRGVSPRRVSPERRAPATPMPVTQVPLRILLVDDDRSFGAILKRSGAKNGLDITVCHDLESLGARMNDRFAVAVVDYDLGSVTGVEIVKYLENQAWSAPFVLISQSELPTTPAHARTGWSFIHKARGLQAIIDAVHAARAADLAGKCQSHDSRPSW